MDKIIKAVVLVGLAVAPVLFAEARCCGRRTVVRRVVCRPASCTPIRIGGCKRYSWVSEAPKWKRLPDDCSMLSEEEQERLDEAFELIPSKILKQAGRTFKQRADYLKRPNALKDRNTFIAKLKKRSAPKQKKVSNGYALKLYDEMLTYGRPLVFGDVKYELEWLAEEYGFRNVLKFIRKVQGTSEKKGRDWKYPMDDPEFKAFAELAKSGACEEWLDLQLRIERMNAVHAEKMARLEGKAAARRCERRM